MEEQEKEVTQEVTQVTEGYANKIENLNNDYESLLKELEELKATDLTYDPNAVLPLKGDSFVKMVHYVNEVEKMIAYFEKVVHDIKTVFGKYEESIQSMALYNSAMGINLMRTHIEFVKSGNTITQEEMDIIDAKSKIKIDE